MEEKPAALVKRRRVSRHEAEALGDLGKGSETEAGAGGHGGGAEPPEEPATGEGGLQTKGVEANKGLSASAPDPETHGAWLAPWEEWTTEGRRKPEARPNIGGTRLCPPPMDPGRERKRHNIGDLLMWQTSRFAPAKVDLKIEKLSGEGTIRYEEVGEDERGSPRGRSVTPE